MGDFYIDLVQFLTFSNELKASFDISQHIKSASRIRVSIATLIDYIYTNNI